MTHILGGMQDGERHGARRERGGDPGSIGGCGKQRHAADLLPLHAAEARPVVPRTPVQHSTIPGVLSFSACPPTLKCVYTPARTLLLPCLCCWEGTCEQVTSQLCRAPPSCFCRADSAHPRKAKYADHINSHDSTNGSTQGHQRCLATPGLVAPDDRAILGLLCGGAVAAGLPVDPGGDGHLRGQLHPGNRCEP